MHAAFLGLPPESVPLQVVSVALLLPCPPALEEKPQREITAGFIRSKYYADFSLSTHIKKQHQERDRHLFQ